MHQDLIMMAIYSEIRLNRAVNNQDKSTGVSMGEDTSILTLLGFEFHVDHSGV